MTTPRPICAHCGSAYGSKAITTESVRWPCGEEMPRYTGNGHVLKTGKPYTTPTRASVRSITMLSVNPAMRACQEADLLKVPERAEQSATREIWDGETWHGGYRPFCTLRCALDYARKAFKKHGAVP